MIIHRQWYYIVKLEVKWVGCFTHNEYSKFHTNYSRIQFYSISKRYSSIDSVQANLLTNDVFETSHFITIIDSYHLINIIKCNMINRDTVCDLYFILRGRYFHSVLQLVIKFFYQKIIHFSHTHSYRTISLLSILKQDVML